MKKVLMPLLALLFLAGCQNSQNRERQALDFLYKYMPLADSTDYSREFFEANVHQTFVTRDEMPWGKDVPDLIFRHFVLPLRVNNENLDSSRTVFYRELKPRVENLGMKDAILEVNHWCHEKVTYQPTDGRTSSPLNTVKTSLGRCGEESTFTVAALRSVGIPARQVYTPRWAHTDDNHAWVEAWADGQWWFLGACEPEAVLNLGWFNAPASRAMLMHTKVFGHYDGPEEVVLQGPNYTEVNLIDNYARTARADVLVVDSEGRPVEGAKVSFMIYNYAEFYPALSKYTGADGRTFLSAGLGDLLAWAVKDGQYGYSRISFGKDAQVTITISPDHPEGPQEIDIVPPPENAVIPEVTPEQAAANNARLAREDSVRHAYMDTFVKEGDPFLVGSMGNHEVIGEFLRRHPDDRARELLGSLSGKDLHDVTMDVLEDSYDARGSVLRHRVANEFLVPYKAWFLRHLSEGEQAGLREPERLIEWTRENIRVIDDPTAWKIPQSPVSVFKYRRTYASSRDVFFVDLARTLGIEARKDVVTGKVQYMDADGTWTDVNFDAPEQGNAPKGTLLLHYVPDGETDNPGYYTNFTISRIVDGMPRLYEFNDGEVDMGGGQSFRQSFGRGVKLDVGTYMLASGKRLSDGSVPVTVLFFEIKEGETTGAELRIRTSGEAAAVIGSFDSEAAFTAEDGSAATVLGTAGRGFFAAGILEVGKEPTNHALNDLSRARGELEAWGRPILLLCTDEAQLSRLGEEIASGRYGQLPSTVRFGIDSGGSVRSSIEANLPDKPGRLPLFILGDTFNKAYFISQGYTIGLGDQLVKTVKKL